VGGRVRIRADGSWVPGSEGGAERAICPSAKIPDYGSERWYHITETRLAVSCKLIDLPAEHEDCNILVQTPGRRLYNAFR